MDEIAADPEVGLEAALAAVPELAEQRAAQLAILEATVDVWSGRVTGPGSFGRIDRDGWQASIAFMSELGLVPEPVTVDDLVDESVLPAR
jgi:hypothetical protein